MADEEHKNPDVKDFFGFKEVLNYYFRKKDPNRKSNFNLRMMHRINRIALITFLLALLFMLGKHLFR